MTTPYLSNFLPIDTNDEWGRTQYAREYEDLSRRMSNELALERDRYDLEKELSKGGLKLEQKRLKESSRQFDVANATNIYGIDKQLEGAKYSADLSASTRRYEADAAIAQSLFGNTLGFASAIGSRGSNPRMANYWG